MQSESNSSTSPTLLGRLRDVPDDPVAWDRFVRRYGARIYAWCQCWHVQDADAQDVTQNVLIKLHGELRSFDYDANGSFRGWLRRVTENKLRDFLRQRREGRVGAADTGIWELLDSQMARDDLHARLKAEFDLELAELAMQAVRERVQENTWQAFQLTEIEQQTSATAAKSLEMKVAAVDMARSRVKRMINQQIADIEAAVDKGTSHA